MLVYPFIGYVLIVLVLSCWGKNFKLGLFLILFVGLAGLLSMLIVAPQMMPIRELLPFSERASTFDNRPEMASMSWSHLLKAVFPWIGGQPGYPDVHWAKGSFEFWIGTFYMGALALLAMPFAFIGFLRRKGDGIYKVAICWGGIMVVLGLLLACGENTPLYPLFYNYVPLMNKFRFASKLLVLVVMGGVVLAGMGLHRILGLNEEKRPGSDAVSFRWLLWGEGVLVFLLGVLVLWICVEPTFMLRIFSSEELGIPRARLDAVLPGILWSYVFLVLAFVWICRTVLSGGSLVKTAAVLLVFLNMLTVVRPIQPTAPEAFLKKVPAVVDRYADDNYRVLSLYADAHQYLYGDKRPDIYAWAMEAGVNTAWYPYKGFNVWFQNGLRLQKYKVLTDGIYQGNTQASNNLMDMTGIRWVIGGAPWQQILGGNANRDLTVRERKSAIPRFSLYAEWQPVVSDEMALRYLVTVENGELHRRPAVEETVLLNGRENTQALPPLIANPSVGKIELSQEKNGSLTFKVHGVSSQLFVVSDTWYPGWWATIDGQEVPIYRANYMFRGVFVPAGEHVVRFDYWPNNFGWYCAASALGLFIVGGLLVSHWWPKRKKS
jgi:hypothetical protein